MSAIGDLSKRRYLKQVEQIDHIHIVVKDIRKAADLFGHILGAKFGDENILEYLREGSHKIKIATI